MRGDDREERERSEENRVKGGMKGVAIQTGIEDWVFTTLSPPNIHFCQWLNQLHCMRTEALTFCACITHLF